MNNTHTPHKEGELYKRVNIGKYTFELRYGYYTESDRAFGEPAVIFPELKDTRLYTDEGWQIVTAVQEPCRFYRASEQKTKEESCIGCIHYSPPGDDIGLCGCRENRNGVDTREDIL